MSLSSERGVSILKVARHPKLGEKYQTALADHERFEAKGLGKVVIVLFSGKKKIRVDNDHVVEIVDAWKALSDETDNE